MISGRTRVLIGKILVFGGFFAGIAFTAIAGGASVLAEVISWSCVIGGGVIWVRGRRDPDTKDVEQPTTLDDSIVLLLRPFDADESALRTGELLKIQLQE